MKLKTFLGVMILGLACTVFSQTVHAAGITGRTGAIKITQPDKTTLTVQKNEKLPAISSGAIVEILEGSMYVAPEKWSIQVVAGNSVVTIEVGVRVLVSIDKETGMADFKVDAGEVKIITGNKTVIVKAGERVQILLDMTTGIVKVTRIIHVKSKIGKAVKEVIREEPHDPEIREASPFNP